MPESRERESFLALSLDNEKVMPCDFCMQKLIAEMSEKINLCNYCGKAEKRDIFCSDECEEVAADSAAECEYERKSLHG